MEKDTNTKYDCDVAGLPPTGRFPVLNMKPEPSEQGISSSVVPESSTYSHDLSRMPDTPSKNVRHRRAHSEILTLPDDITFDSDLGVVGLPDGPAFSDETDEDLFSMYLDMEKVNSSSATSQLEIGEPSSAAAQAALHPQWSGHAGGMESDNVHQRPRIRHQHSFSMDGSTTINHEMLASGGEETSATKKATSAAKIAELALLDPKRAKRILANRQSAARSKERKMRYIAELERKVQNLQTEATTMSAQLSLLRRDTNGVNAENNELKLRLQTIEQQVHLQDALNDALKEEIQHMRRLTGQAMANGGPISNLASTSSFGVNQAFYPNNQKMHSLLTAQQQFQQMQINSQKQHQFQPHQQQHVLNQLKQQQQMQQHEQSQNQRVGDIKFGGLIPPSSQRENASD
ncbi:hypothetical protein V2J09_006370 [Rumex salicifolius]